jgi:hypothetical protein
MSRPDGVSRPPLYVPAHQADATLSQANPVSTTLYEVLPTTRNVRLYSIATMITWAVTQPTPLEVVVTIDGVSYVFAQTNPVSATNYYALISPENSEATQFMITSDETAVRRAFMLEGRSVRVQVRVTWAVTQPTPLVCRVRYAKW